MRRVLGAIVLACVVLTLEGVAAADPVPPSQPYVPGRTIVERVDATFAIQTVPLTTGCLGALWAIVDDVPDAALFAVTVGDSRPGEPDVVETFNRHERGDLRPEELAAYDAGPGKVAGLLVSGSLDGPGDRAQDCLDLRGDYEEFFSIKAASVTRFVVNTPTDEQAAYEVLTKAIPPAADGPDGKDACRLGYYISVPKRPAVKSYEVNVITRYTGGGTRTTTYDLAPNEFDPTPPEGSIIPRYRVADRLGHYLSESTWPSNGCTHALWQWLGGTRVPSIVRVTLKVNYPSCFGKQPTIVATGPNTNGTEGADVILGRPGADKIDGRGGSDLICGGGGTDDLRGGAGDDRINGGPGVDSINGGPGKDICVGSADDAIVACEP